MINKINKERRRLINATPTRPSNKSQRQGAQEDPKGLLVMLAVITNDMIESLHFLTMHSLQKIFIPFRCLCPLEKYLGYI
jgi:hypothetical protein